MCLMYTVSFTEAEAKCIPSTHKLLCNMNARTKGTMNYKCKRNKEVRRLLPRKQEEEEEVKTKGKQVN